MKLYTCEYCYKAFEPRRRRVQKYCSNTCRSKAFHAKKNNKNKPVLKNNILKDSNIENTPPSTKIDSMSISGVGNAAAGNLIASGLKSFLTPNQNKPATKGDIDNLISLFNKRYLPIENIAVNQFGQFPFYDVQTKSVVYLNLNNNEKVI